MTDDEQTKAKERKEREERERRELEDANTVMMAVSIIMGMTGGAS